MPNTVRTTLLVAVWTLALIAVPPTAAAPAAAEPPEPAVTVDRTAPSAVEAMDHNAASSQEPREPAIEGFLQEIDGPEALPMTGCPGTSCGVNLHCKWMSCPWDTFPTCVGGSGPGSCTGECACTYC